LQKASCNLDFCIPNWDCSGWSACIEADKIEEGREGFVQTRECRDLNGCGNIRRKPIEIVECNTLGCLSNFECGIGKGLCDYNENTIEILMGNEILHGLEVRECSDLNECADDYTDNRACVSDSNIYFEEKLVCGKKNIVAYNTETDRPIFQIDLEKWRNDEFNVLFLQSDVIYCESCYNGLRDSEEGDVDCGGECKECLPEVKGISFIKNTKWSLWFLILLLIALLVWLWNEERRKRRRIKKEALDWIRASFLELKT
jgi:predicted nucleic acid-binding Zn ribbon protein